MPVSVVSFDGHAINDGVSYRAAWLNYSAAPPAKASLVPQAGADSVDSGQFTVEGRSVALSVRILDYADRDTLAVQLKSWFKRGTDGDLVVAFPGDSDQFQITCRVVNLVLEASGVDYTVILASGQTALRAVSAETHSMTLTGTGGSYTIDIDGDTDDETRLSVSLTPTGLPTLGYLYQNIYRLPNKPGFDFGKRPWVISLNTAALVTAGKMQADCDDLRVFDGETEIKRWISGPNTTTTKIWFLLDMSAGFYLGLRTAVAGSGDIDLLKFSLNGSVRKKLRQLPATGILYHGTEWISYNHVNVDACQVRVEQRGVYSTTLQAHSIGDAFLWIEHPIILKYGNSAVSAPSTEDDDYDLEKPLFDLSSSTDASWVWTASTLFRDPTTPSRTGKWRQAARRLGGESGIYNFTQDAESGNPAMGMKLGAYYKNGAWHGDTVTLTWQLECPAGITTATATGKKYRNVNGWPAKVGLQRSPNGTDWYTVWLEATPASVNTWTNWSTHSAVSLGSTTKFVRFMVKGSGPAAADALQASECLTCTFAFESSNLPSGSLLGETSNYPLVVTIANDFNGDSLELDFLMRLNKALVLDGEAYTAKYHGTNAHGAMSLDDESRPVWIRLQPGANEISIDGADVGSMDVVLSWYRRRL